VSITRLQQARQMYAMGQRVAKTLDGSRPGYRGDDAARSSEGTSAGRADPGAGAGYGDGPSSSDRDTNTREDNSPQATGDSPPLQRATPMDVKEQYAVGTPTILGAPITPAAVSPQLENIRNDNRIDALNLQNSIYKPINIPPFVPGGMILNTVGNFIGNLGYKKNTQFFADNVAGKYGYGYGLDAYKDYMKARQLGNVNAYGRPLTEGELRLRDGDSGGGIMDVTVNETTDETADDTTNEDGSLILRYLHDNPKEVVNLQAMGVKDTDEMLQVMLERAKNLYTT